MYDVNNKMCKLLGIDNEYVINKFQTAQERVFCDCFEEGDSGTKNIDIGYGVITVTIDRDEDELRWKFTPSKKMEKGVLRVIQGFDSDIIVQALGKKWMDKIMKELGEDEQEG